MDFGVYCCFCGCKKCYFDSSRSRDRDFEADQLDYYIKEFWRRPNYCYDCNLSIHFTKQNSEARILLNSALQIFRNLFARIITPRSQFFPGFSEFFRPKIDEDLFPRFYKMCNGFEHLLFALSFKDASKYVELQPLIVTKNLKLHGENYYIPDFDDSNILITESVSIYNIEYTEFPDADFEITNRLYISLLTSMNSGKLIFNPKFIELYNFKITAANFNQILSVRTVVLKCKFVTFTTVVKFSTLTQMLPKIKNLSLEKTNMGFDKSWVESLLNDCKKFKDLQISIENLNIDIECLSTFRKETFDNKLLLKLEDIIYDEELRHRLSGYSLNIYYCKRKKLLFVLKSKYDQ